MKITKIQSKKTVLIALAVLMVIGGFFATPTGKVALAAALKRDLPIYNVQKDTKVTSLSFDAAWGNEDTQQLIDILGKYKVKATFFVVGDWVDKYPESVKALHDAGHEIMNHSNKHDHMPKLSAEQIMADINACNDKIEKITGVRPILFRPPYGDYDDKLVSTIRSMNMYTVQWDVETRDIKIKTVSGGSSSLFLCFPCD